MNGNARITLKISLKFVPKVRINNILALVQIMAWRRPGDKPLCEPMLVSLLTHICVSRPQWVNCVNCICIEPLLDLRYQKIVKYCNRVFIHVVSEWLYVGWWDIDGLMQVRSNSSALAMKLLHSSTEPSVICLLVDFPDKRLTNQRFCQCIGFQIQTSFSSHSHRLPLKTFCIDDGGLEPQPRLHFPNQRRYDWLATQNKAFAVMDVMYISTHIFDLYHIRCTLYPAAMKQLTNYFDVIKPYRITRISMVVALLTALRNTKYPSSLLNL